MLEEVQPFAGVQALLREVRGRGFRIALASSGKQEHIEHYLGLVNGKELADAWTTSADVRRTKPAPDLLEAALRRVHGTAGVLVGDSVWDFRAAAALGAPGYAVRSGGFSVEELCAAGATDVYDSPEVLLQCLDETLLAGRHRSCRGH